MINLQVQTPTEGWIRSFQELLKTKDINEGWLWKDDTLCIEILDPGSLDQFHIDFPMDQSVLQEYNQFMITGENGESVQAEHQIYHYRLFKYLWNINQIDYIIQTLREKPTRKRAIAIGIDQPKDMTTDIYPCMIYLWVVIQHGKLNLHIHFRANDAYKKILMDFNVGITIMKYIAQCLNVPVGTYTHIVDSLHFYEIDKWAVEMLQKKFI